MFKFFRSLTGQLVLMVALAGGVAWGLYKGYNADVQAVPPVPAQQVTKNVTIDATDATPKPPPESKPEAQPRVAAATGNAIRKLILPEAAQEPTVQSAPSIPKAVRAVMLTDPRPTTLFVDPPVQPAPEPKMSQAYAPYGRIIHIKLVTGLESSNLATPLVGITVEDVWNRDQDGQPHLIIPAGIEVHGPGASLGRVRNRLDVTGRFIFVWRTNDENNGLELPVQAIALTYDVDPETNIPGPDDRKAGIRGDLIDNTSDTELKLFAAAFLKGISSGMLNTTTTLNPLVNQSVTAPSVTLKNGAIAGTTSVLDEYASRIRKELEANGFYVVVPAGRDFYLYINQTIDLRNAQRGAFLANNVSSHSPSPNDSAH